MKGGNKFEKITNEGRVGGGDVRETVEKWIKGEFEESGKRWKT